MRNIAPGSFDRLALRSRLASNASDAAECSYRPQAQQITLRRRCHQAQVRCPATFAELKNFGVSVGASPSSSRCCYTTHATPYASRSPPLYNRPFPAASQWSSESPAPNLSTSLATVQSGVKISSDVLLDVLNTKDKEYYQLLRSKLPPDFHRLDAYLMLRGQDPEKLSNLSALTIDRLIKRAGKEGLAGVLSLLLADIVGSRDNVTNTNSSSFKVAAESQSRYRLLQTLLVNCNRDDLLHDDTLALQLFQLLIDDYKSFSDPSVFSNCSVPPNFPQGHAKSLVERILQTKSIELVPILQALRTHLEQRTPTFPSAREASELINFYLQSSIRDFDAALDVVRTLKDTHALDQDAIQRSIQDGRSYFNYIKSVSGDLGPQALERLEFKSLEVSLRLISLYCLLAQRLERSPQYLSVHQTLMDSFDLKLLPNSAFFGPPGLPGEVAFKAFHDTFLQLLTQSGIEPLRQILSLMRSCDSRLLAMLSSDDLQRLCDVADTHYTRSISARVYLQVIKAKTRVSANASDPSPYAFSLVRDGFLVNADTFISILQHLSSSGHSLSAKALMRGLRLLPFNTTSTTQLHLRLKGAQRGRFISALAGARMQTEAFELFQLWSGYYYDPDEARVPVSLNLDKPLSLRPRYERLFGASKEELNSVASSPSCLVDLVRSLCRGSTARNVERGRLSAHYESNPDAEEFVHQARFAIRVFKHAKRPNEWTHHTLTALATACFHVRDTEGAFEALARLNHLRHRPDLIDISVMLGGLTTSDPDKAVNLFIAHSTFVDELQLRARVPPEQLRARVPSEVVKVGEAGKDTNSRWTSEPESQNAVQSADGTIPRSKRMPTPRSIEITPMRPSVKLTSLLMSRVLAQGRLDLVERLIGFAKKAGIFAQLTFGASMSLLYQANLAPQEIVKVVKRLMAENWSPDPALLDVAARHVLLYNSVNFTQATHRDDKEQATRSAEVPHVEASDDDVEASQSQLQTSSSDAKHESMKSYSKSHAESVAKPLEKESAYERISRVQTAVYLMEVSLSAKDLVNLQIAKLALSEVRFLGTRYRPRKPASDEGTIPLGTNRSDPRAKWVALIDRIVYLLRWTTYFDTGHQYRQGMPLLKCNKDAEGGFVSVDLADLYDLALAPKDRPDTYDRSSLSGLTERGAKADASDPDMSEDAVLIAKRQPNVLPSQIYCRVLETYLAWGDTQGAAEVAAWMRDEAGADVGQTTRDIDAFVTRVKVALEQQQQRQGSLEAQSALDGSDVLSMLSGQQSTPRLKPWWRYRD